MATQLARTLENRTNRIIRPIPPDNCSTETFIRIREVGQTLERQSTSTFIMEPDESAFSVEVDRWISGDNSANIDSSIQSRVVTTQRSTLVTSSSLIGGGMWYILAMMIPLLGAGNHGINWRCSPSVLLRTVELLCSKLATVCARTRSHIRNIAHDQIVREIFATAMDIVLVIYAVGFLVLSMCQATVVNR